MSKRHAPAQLRAARAELQRQWRLLRAAAGKSQVDVELEADLPRGKQWRMENGLDAPTDDERSRLARVLGVPADHIPGLVEQEATEERAAS